MDTTNNYAGRVISTSSSLTGDWEALVWCFDANKPIKVVVKERIEINYTDEVLSLYKEHQRKEMEIARYEKRITEVLARRLMRQRLFRYSKLYSINAFKLLKYFKEGRLTLKTVDKILNLFDKRVKNPFKISLRKQIIEWSNNPNPSFKVPLSYKQMEKVYEM